MQTSTLSCLTTLRQILSARPVLPLGLMGWGNRTARTQRPKHPQPGTTGTAQRLEGRVDEDDMDLTPETEVKPIKFGGGV